MAESPSVEATLSHYRLIEPIGAGAMGMIYRARDTRLERDVALKVLPAGLLADPVARRRFRAEALALSQLNHPNVATVFDFDSQEGVDFLVMELIPGRTLAELLEQGPVPASELLPLALQLAEGLAAAHERGVVHRDLKPANILVTPEGRLKILDFGLARHTADAENAPTVTSVQVGTIVGTMAYMAPEVLAGTQADARADVFASGIVLYQMATGRHPFPADTPSAVVHAILNREPDPPSAATPGLPAGLEAVIASAMRRDPAERPASGGDLLAALKAIASGTVAPIPARRRAPARAARTRIRSLAVLPLDNLSGDPSQDFFADGMTEALIASLARIDGLRVISRTSAMRFKGVRRPLPEIAAELGVDAVIEGSVARSGERVRITAELIHAASDTHLWGESFDRDLSDVLTLQSEAARAIADQIRIKLSPKSRARLAESRRVDPAAYEAFLQGRYHANRRTEESLRRGREHFNDAIARDPSYALAHVGLADVYNLLGYISGQAPGVVFPRAKAAARYALELEPQLGEAHISLAYVHLYYDWDWAASDREFLRGIELNPSYPQSHLWYANLLAARRRFEEALTQGGRCLELDPLSPIANLSQGWVRYFMHDYEQSAADLEKGRDVDPTFSPSRLFLGWTYLQMGRHADAVGEFEAAAQHAAHTPTTVLTLAHAAALGGDPARARSLYDEVLAQERERYVPSYLAAMVCEALGERERAWDWLERAVADRSHWLVFMDVEPRFDPFRSDSRWEWMRRAVGV